MVRIRDDEFRALLGTLRPVIGEMADAFWLGAILDPERARDIHAVAQALAAELLDETYVKRHILLEPPSEEKVSGEYPVGVVTYADRPVCPFGLREGDLPQHLAILGRSGAGKTNVGHLIVWNLLRADKPFTVLDWRGNYTSFLNRNEGRDVLLYFLGEPKSLSFNPLEPPPNLTYNQAEAYLRDVVSVVCSTYLPGHQLLSTRGVEYFFLKTIGPMWADRGGPVTFNDVRGHIERYKTSSRERDWKASALNTLFKLTTGPVGRIINSRSEMSLPAILRRPVILELSGLGSETDRKLFSQVLLLWLYYYRLAEGKSASFKHALIIEEAHNLFLRRPGEQQSLHDFILRQMRDLGESLILLDQNPSLLTVPSLGNTGVTICLNLKHANDVAAAGKALTLPPENWDYVGRLPVGHAIVKMQDRWVKPFLVRFPRFTPSGPSQATQGPGRHYPGDSPRRSAEAPRWVRHEAIRPLPGRDRTQERNEGISPQEAALLVDIAKHRLATVTERYRRLGWSAHTGTAVKGNLMEKGLIEQEDVRVPNGSVTLLKATGKGKEQLASLGVQFQSLPKNASLEHEYWKHLVAGEYRRKGYSVQEEVPVGGGRAVDLVATRDGKKTAIEIETGKSDIEGNVRKCKEAGFDEVVTVRTDGVTSKTVQDTCTGSEGRSGASRT